MTSKSFLTSLQTLADRLRLDTDAGRITIRLESEKLGSRLERVAVESLDQGVGPLLSEIAENIRTTVAPRWLIANRRTFVMDDCLNPSDPELAPEPYLVEGYGVRAEMLQPVFIGEDLIAIISVHYTKGPRQWTDQDVSRIEAAGERLHDMLVSRVSPIGPS